LRQFGASLFKFGIEVMCRLFNIFIIALLGFACTAPENNPPPQGLNVTELIGIARTLRQTNTDSAFALAKHVYEYAKSTNSVEGIAISSLFLGEILYEMGSISQSNSLLNEAKSGFLSTGDEANVAATDLMLSRIYQRSENYREAFVYLEESNQLYEEQNDRIGLANVYADLGHVHEKLGDYDSAIFYQERALESFRIARDTAGLAMIYDNIGSIQEDQAAYALAIRNFFQAYQLNQAIRSTSNVIINLNNLGDIHRKTGRMDSALFYTRQALEMAKANRLDYQVKSAYRDLSKLYQDINNADSAYYYLNLSYELTDALFSRQIAEEIARSQAIYDLQQKQQRITLLERSESTNRKLAILGWAGALGIIIFGGIIFRQQQQKSKKSRQLLEAEAELTRIELENAHLSERTLKTELENKQLREIQLSQELEMKSKSLTKSTLHMIQKNEFLHLMRSKLKNLKKVDDPEVKKVIKRLIRSIDINSNVDDDWKEFETVFAQVHSSFYEKLKESYPDLSPTETRLCAMIRLNLHSKDIATIMGISNDSLRTARYRLRKRLKISKGDNLYSRLMEI